MLQETGSSHSGDVTAAPPLPVAAGLLPGETAAVSDPTLISSDWLRSSADSGNPGSTTYYIRWTGGTASWSLDQAPPHFNYNKVNVEIYIPRWDAGALAHYQIHDLHGTTNVTWDQENLSGWYRVGGHTFSASPSSPIWLTLSYGGTSSHPGDHACLADGTCTELAANQVRFVSSS